MGRFSPTVLPRRFDFGGIIDRAAEGYLRGRGIGRQRRLDREREEDGNRYIAALRTQQLSQPGAQDLSTAIGQYELTPEAGRRLGSADVQGTPEELMRGTAPFVGPEPTEVKLPGGETLSFQERSPYVTETGVVIDPARARQERTLGAFLDAQALREPIRKPHEREGFGSQDEYFDYLGGEARATGQYQQRTRPPAGRAPPKPMSYIEAYSDLYARYGSLDENGNLVLPPSASLEWRQQAMEAIRAGEEPPPLPPPPTARPISAGPPEEEGTPLLERIGQGVGKFVSGFRAGGEPAEELEAVDAQRGVETGQSARDEPRERRAPPRAATPPRVPAAREEPPDLPPPRGLEGLQLDPAQQASYHNLIQQGWSHEDAVDSLAADEWDALVAEGVAPDEATRRVAQKYGFTEGQ